MGNHSKAGGARARAEARFGTEPQPPRRRAVRDNAARMAGVTRERRPVPGHVRIGGFGGIDGLVNSEGDVRILPYHLKEQGGMDGFFISRMQRVA